MNTFNVIEEREQSVYHMAFSYLNRINIWFYIAGECASKLDSWGWFQALSILFRELSTEMKPDEITKFTDEITNLNSIIVKDQYNNQKMSNKGMSMGTWKRLNDFELDLRKVLRESGLQQKIKEDPRKAIFQR